MSYINYISITWKRKSFLESFIISTPWKNRLGYLWRFFERESWEALLLSQGDVQSWAEPRHQCERSYITLALSFSADIVPVLSTKDSCSSAVIPWRDGRQKTHCNVGKLYKNGLKETAFRALPTLLAVLHETQKLISISPGKLLSKCKFGDKMVEETWVSLIHSYEWLALEKRI